MEKLKLRENELPQLALMSAALSVLPASVFYHHMLSAASRAVLAALNADQIRAMSSDELDLVLTRPPARMPDGKVSPAYQRWVRVVLKHGLALARRKKDGPMKSYRTGRGAHRGRQRIQELEDCTERALKCLQGTTDDLVAVLKHREANGEKRTTTTA